MDRRSRWLIEPNAEELAALLLELANNPEQLTQSGASDRDRAMSLLANKVEVSLKM